MIESLKKLRIFNGNTLKIIAAIAMLIDHVGFMFFPFNMVFRAIGRLAMPLFAFMIAESARYTRNKTKHFLMLFGLGAICQLVYYIAMGDTYINILITFSLSTLMLYALDWIKTSIYNQSKEKKAKTLSVILASLVFILTVLGTYLLCHFCTVDYGFWGCMLPVFANLFDFRSVKKKLGDNTPKWMEKCS